MAIVYDDGLKQKITGQRTVYTDTDTMLHALSIGLGRDPLNEKELPFVFEQGGIRVAPIMAAELARGYIARGLNLDMTLVRHGQQRLKLHRPMPPSDALISESRIVEVLDRGAGKGALVYSETVVSLGGEDQPLLTLDGTIFARGFGGPAGPTPAVHKIPDRAPDIRHVIETRADQALLYRLNGDHDRQF